jgi:hypothetical protein
MDSRDQITEAPSTSAKSVTSTVTYTTVRTVEVKYIMMTSQTHRRERSNSLPITTTSNMVNPFLVETDEPDHPVTSNVPRSISPMNDLGPHNLPRLSTPPMQSRDFALPSADPPPTSVHDEANLLAERLKDMEIEMSHLKQERDEARNSARFYNQEGSRLRDYREGTHGTSSTFTNEHPRSKIKPSDLPKFYGKDNEDVDEWIEKVSAIFTYSRARDIDLLRILPLLLHGNASDWFTTLGE